MPPKKVYRKRRAAKKGPRKSKKDTTTMRVPRNTIIPDRAIVRFPYVDVQTIIPSTSLNYYGQKSYNINSIWDPETFSLNTSVLGWEQWQAFYESYRIHDITYEITLFNPSDACAVSGCLFFAPYNDGSVVAVGDPSVWLTQPRSRKFYIGNKSGGKSTVCLKGKMSMPSLLGMTNEQYRVSSFTSSTWSTNPIEKLAMFINTLSTDLASVQNLVQMSVKLTYTAELFGRIQIPRASTAFDDTPR